MPLAFLLYAWKLVYSSLWHPRELYKLTNKMKGLITKLCEVFRKYEMWSHNINMYSIYAYCCSTQVSLSNKKNRQAVPSKDISHESMPMAISDSCDQPHLEIFLSSCISLSICFKLLLCLQFCLLASSLFLWLHICHNSCRHIIHLPFTNLVLHIPSSRSTLPKKRFKKLIFKLCSFSFFSFLGGWRGSWVFMYSLASFCGVSMNTFGLPGPTSNKIDNELLLLLS